MHRLRGQQESGDESDDMIAVFPLGDDDHADELMQLFHALLAWAEDLDALSPLSGLVLFENDASALSIHPIACDIDVVANQITTGACGQRNADFACARDEEV